MELYLIRHGNTQHEKLYYNTALKALDPPLTALGWAQAEKVARRMEGVKLEAVYSSDLVRALCTAKVIASHARLGVAVEPALREIDMGELQIRSWGDFPDLHVRWSRHESDLPYPGGECGVDAWRRCAPLIDSIVRSGAKRVAAVAHGGTIRCILAGLLGLPFERRFYLGAPLENCSVTTLVYKPDEGRFYLNGFNDAAHLRD